MFFKPPHGESISTDFAEHRYEPFVRTMPSLASNTVMSPGRRAAQSTKPPPSGALKVVMKNDSPLSTLRFSDFMKPPSAFDSISTPPDMPIIAPDSARHSSPEDIWMRATAKPGLCLTVISIEFLQGPGGEAEDPIDARQRSWYSGATFSWRLTPAARRSLSVFSRWTLRSCLASFFACSLRSATPSFTAFHAASPRFGTFGPFWSGMGTPHRPPKSSLSHRRMLG